MLRQTIQTIIHSPTIQRSSPTHFKTKMYNNNISLAIIVLSMAFVVCSSLPAPRKTNSNNIDLETNPSNGESAIETPMVDEAPLFEVAQVDQEEQAAKNIKNKSLNNSKRAKKNPSSRISKGIRTAIRVVKTIVYGEGEDRQGSGNSNFPGLLSGTG